MIRHALWVLLPVLPLAMGCNSIAGLNDLNEVDCVGDACTTEGGSGGVSGGAGQGGLGGTGGAGKGGAAGVAGVAGQAGASGKAGAGAGGVAGTGGGTGGAGTSGASGAGMSGTSGGGGLSGTGGVSGMSGAGQGGASGAGQGGASGAAGEAGASGAGMGGCQPVTCEQVGRTCGMIDDGCGNQIDCGTCGILLDCGGAPGRPNLCGCAPGSYICNGNQLFRCADNGATTYVVAECAEGTCDAQNGQCGQCVPGSNFCKGQQLLKCDANDMSTPIGSPCAGGQFCDPTGNTQTAQCDSCVANSFFCVGPNLRQCNGQGNGNSFIDTCDNSALCDRGVFLGKCPPIVCQPGEVRCSGAQAQKCNAAQDGWDTVETCASAALCSAGVCTPPTCAADEKSCEGNSQKKCNADRTGFEVVACKVPTPACEKGECVARGPTLVEVMSSDGVPFYIDSTEVTVGQYKQFLATSPDPKLQTAPCTWNAGFSPPKLPEENALPVSEVDWCDARAYCEWAGKRLCGKVGEGSLPSVEIKNRKADMWYISCTGPSDTTYPYGSAYAANACNGKDFQANPAATNVGSLPLCSGGFNGLFDMSGNMAEWVDSCSVQGVADGSQDYCRARGGSYLSAFNAMQCDSQATVLRSNPSKFIGFRCCADQ